VVANALATHTRRIFVTQKTKNAQQNNRNLIIIGIITAVALIAVVAIALSASGTTIGGVTINYDELPQERQADGGFVLGDPDAPVTIVAFEDFLCPACQGYTPTLKQFVNDYVVTGRARFEYRMLPAVDPTYSRIAASLAECSEILEPGSFWYAYDELFRLASAERFNNNSPRRFAETMGLSYAELLDCSSEQANQWQVDQQLAQQSGVTGTPTILVRYGNGALRPSPVGPRPDLAGLSTIVNTASN
jgi:protein-disulfide isomerase